MLTKLVILISMFAAPLLIIPQSTAVAACVSAQCQAVQGGVNTANGGAQTTSSDLDDTVKTAINLLSIVAGIAAIAMIIVAGYKYITSAGNAEKTKSAKNTLIYAIVGLAVVALSQTIAHFVLTQAANPSTTGKGPVNTTAPAQGAGGAQGGGPQNGPTSGEGVN